jgi:hypothetical protein
MGRKILILFLVVSLGGLWASFAAAGEMGYSLRQSERGFKEPAPQEPNSGVIFLDAAIGRPLGLATTIVGTGLFVVTLPFTAPSGDVGPAARALMGDPAGWTFLRPLGRSDPRFEDRGVFPVEVPR